jgi:hypothetical protein
MHEENRRQTFPGTLLLEIQCVSADCVILTLLQPSPNGALFPTMFGEIAYQRIDNRH